MAPATPERSDYYAIVAHELRNPLEALRAMSRMLRRQGRSSDDTRVFAAMEEEASAALALLDALTDMAAIEAGHLRLKPRELELTRVVRRAVEAHQTTEHPVAFDDGDPVRAVADERSVGQVLRNLLSNAAKYSPAGSPIRVAVMRADERVVVCVQDQGSGVPAQERSRLFQKFARLSTAGSTTGSGLGLYISRMLARDQGGDLWAEWPDEGGSIFSFAVPAA